jgi:ABC-type Mn2+/Zn2+ transport system permease subunit
MHLFLIYLIAPATFILGVPFFYLFRNICRNGSSAATVASGIISTSILGFPCGYMIKAGRLKIEDGMLSKDATISIFLLCFAFVFCIAFLVGWLKRDDSRASDVLTSIILTAIVVLATLTIAFIVQRFWPILLVQLAAIILCICVICTDD